MVKIVLYTNTISPHQLPLAKELAARVGDDNFRYIYTEVADKDHGGLGWTLDVPDWCVHASDADANEWLENAEMILVGGLRPIGLCERRAASGKTTLYMSERWFKPPVGMFRLLCPSYRRMAERFVRLLDVCGLVYLPIGIYAARDMARLYGLIHGDWRCLFRAPELEFEKKPGGKVWLKNEPRNTQSTRKYCLDKMRMWGYFVEPSKFTGQNSQTENTDDNPKTQTQDFKLKTLRVLWVGRLLKIKRVDTIIRAVGELSRTRSNSNLQLQLDIYGTGPEEDRLKKLSANYGDIINFYPPVPIDEVRKLMREHDIYVLASNAYEGWGAVVSEALEEGMMAIGTYEAGSTATLLPNSNLFHSGDWKGLLKLLQKDIPSVDIGDWSARKSAEVIDV